MELEWAMPSPMPLAQQAFVSGSVNGKGIGSDSGHGPELGIGFGSIGPGYSIGYSGISSSMIYGSTQAGNRI
ncbi:hypothetical protein SUGI_1487340 [Cryptomeria japonica]|uniref:Uncharacterized protein n=1 Tax=Cryptomeria japonica TaxID=3369 RepID=A0AAD3NT31_CRYJA|nr:hypothetical protein SUGI_1449710 [Cryptomeria japonica]GLJ58612.1 hypothetical protein SUGI_1463560 [Cryptomeria japonica]GLJ58985.1 hypothetical protein SUGI_1487340 [Cryptomeria japonica]